MEPDEQTPADDREPEQRAILAEAIQRAVTEHEPDGGLVTGFFCVIEARNAGDGSRPYLMYRTGDINGEGLTSWQALGFLHSAVLAVEEQHFGGARPAHGED